MTTIRLGTDVPGKPLQVVLVHGAFSEGSYWRRVLRILTANGVHGSAAQVNVLGFEADVDALRRHLDARADADVLLVGHSYGGALISEVSADNPQVKGLVYVAAAAPVAGVPFSHFMAEHPSFYRSNPILDCHGRLWLRPEDCVNGLGHDLPEDDARMLYAVQKPVAAAAFDDVATREGWRTKPCWYLVTEADRMFDPDSQRLLARTMNAVTRSVDSGHMVALSQPGAVAAIITEAIESLSATGCMPAVTESAEAIIDERLLFYR